MKDTINITGSLGGIQLAGAITQTVGSQFPSEVTVPAAKAGTLTTRTNANTGTLTMGSGHGIQTGDIVDLYFGSGLVQRDVTVGTVSGTSVPIDGGTGDDLPTATSAVVVCKQVVVDAGSLVLTGGALVGVSMYCKKAAHAIFDDGSSGQTYHKLPAGQPKVWVPLLADTAPITDTIAEIRVSQSDTASSQIVKLGISANVAT